jgi:Rrf2 family protein
MVPATTSDGDGLHAVLRVSARADYAIRVMVALSLRPDVVLPREQLAEAEGLPVKFVDHVLRQLRYGGLIESRRGRTGGYWLSRPAELITVADIVHVMDQPTLGKDGPERVASAEWLAAVWTGLSDAVHAALADVTVAAMRDARLAEEVRA